MLWKPLQLSPAAGAHLPSILISTVFGAASYTVHLTDVTHIWSESLNKEDIIRRSREEHTSIDPSNGDQFKILLQKIKLGLEAGNGTTTSLTINTEASRPSLILHLTVALPGGLQPLEWPVRLRPGSAQLLSGQLTIPLLQAQHTQSQELVDLTDMLRDKDHVIQKLVDKLEDQGIDLGQVFPQAAGKPGRKVDRKRAEERVKGLLRFDADAWSKSSQSLETTKGLSGLLSDEAMGFLEEVSEWWEDLGGITVNLGTGKISTKGVIRDRKIPTKTPPPLPPKEDSIDENDDFQVQSTPPPRGTAPSAIIESSDADDDDDLDAPSQHSKIPDSFPASHPPVPPPSPPKVTKKPGTIGKKKQRSPEPNRDPEPEPEAVDNDATATEDESLPSSPPPAQPLQRTPTPPPLSPKPKAKKGLGKLGGKRAAPPPSSSPPSAPKTPSTPPAISSPSKKRQLGKIGGKSKQLDDSSQREIETETADRESSQPARKDGEHVITRHRIGIVGHKKGDGEGMEEVAKGDEGNERKGQAKRQEEEVEEEVAETPDERADRKRAQLKRELEEKARAPVKKKRRF